MALYVVNFKFFKASFIPSNPFKPVASAIAPCVLAITLFKSSLSLPNKAIAPCIAANPFAAIPTLSAIAWNFFSGLKAFIVFFTSPIWSFN